MKSNEKKTDFLELKKRVVVAHVLALIALSLFTLVLNTIMKERSARQTVSLIRRMVERDEMRGVVEALSTAKLENFSGVIFFSDTGARIFSLPADLSGDLIQDHRPQFNLTQSYYDVPIKFGTEDGLGLVRFIYPRFTLFPYAFGIWIFAILLTTPIIQSEKRKLVAQSEADLISKTNSLKADLASKVRHNIRSPLFALKAALDDGDIAIDKDVINHTVKRIGEIISELEETPSGELILAQKHKDQRTNVSLSVQKIVNEKWPFLLKYFPGITLIHDLPLFDVISPVDEGEFETSVSNLIDNAIEATQKLGKVTVGIRAEGDFAVVVVRDDGIGIEEEDLDRVFEKGFTKGKEKGTGMGLHYVNTFANEVGGFVEAESRVGAGSTFRLHIPMSSSSVNPPKEIKISEGSDVILLDDQELDHFTWKIKFSPFKDRIRLHFFKEPGELIKWHKEADLKSPLYLIDYNLGEGLPLGTDVIDTLKISNRSIVVTGQADDLEVKRRCQELSCSLLSKLGVSSTPIVINQS